MNIPLGTSTTGCAMAARNEEAVTVSIVADPIVYAVMRRVTTATTRDMQRLTILFINCSIPLLHLLVWQQAIPLCCCLGLGLIILITSFPCEYLKQLQQQIGDGHKESCSRLEPTRMNPLMFGCCKFLARRKFVVLFFYSKETDNIDVGYELM